jgi:hypothetical protein
MNIKSKGLLVVYFVVGLIVGNLKYENDQLQRYLRMDE